MSEKKLFTLSPRLQAAAQFVRKGSVTADIGTDHAYLPVWLIKNNIIPRAYACDIGTGPLSSACENINAYGVNDSVKTVLSDGLTGLFSEKDKIDDIVICGMGGELISYILENSGWTKNSRYSFVLQPMSKQEFLRKWLYKNGFAIEKEQAVSDAKHVYTVMLVVYTGEEKQIDDFEAYTGKLLQSDGVFVKEYLARQCRRLEKERAGAEAAGDSENSRRIERLINRITEVMEDWCEKSH